MSDYANTFAGMLKSERDSKQLAETQRNNALARIRELERENAALRAQLGVDEREGNP